MLLLALPLLTSRLPLLITAGLATLMIENPFNRLTIVGAVSCDGRLGVSLRGRLTRRPLATISLLFSTALLAILPPAVTACLLPVTGPLITVSRPPLTVTGSLFTAVVPARIVSVGRLAGLLLAIGRLSLLTRIGLGRFAIPVSRSRLACSLVPLRLTSRLLPTAGRLTGRATELALSLLRRLPAPAGLPRLLLVHSGALLPLPLFRTRRSAGVLKARLAPRLVGLLRSLLLRLLGLILAAARRLLVGPLVFRAAGFGVVATRRSRVRGLAVCRRLAVWLVRLSLRPLGLGVGRRRGQFIDDQLPPRRGGTVWLGLPVVEHHRPILNGGSTGRLLGGHHAGADPQPTAAPGIGPGGVGLPEHPVTHGGSAPGPRLDPHQ